MKKVPTIPSLALKALEIVYASKQKLYIRNQKEMKLLVTKNPHCSSFGEKVEKIFPCACIVLGIPKAGKVKEKEEQKTKLKRVKFFF